MNLSERMAKILYTIEHRKAFRRVERRLLGKNTLRGYTHDLLKIPLILITGKKASKIHRRFSRHHDKARTKKDYTEMIVDWECARYTKPDKPLNAVQTLEKFYPHLKEEITPILKELNLL